jgi:hypothetical protein
MNKHILWGSETLLGKYQGKRKRYKYTCIISNVGSPSEFHVTSLQSRGGNEYMNIPFTGK